MDNLVRNGNISFNFVLRSKSRYRGYCVFQKGTYGWFVNRVGESAVGCAFNILGYCGMYSVKDLTRTCFILLGITECFALEGKLLLVYSLFLSVLHILL